MQHLQKTRGEVVLLWLTRHPMIEDSDPVGKGACPERRAVSASPDRVGTIGSEGSLFRSLQSELVCVWLIANRKKHSVTNTAFYFAASNSRTITRSISSGCGSGSFSTSPPLTTLNSTLLPSGRNRAERTGRGIPARASTG